MKNKKIIELTVKNHPGTMSHITGLFSRRGFNLEGILCAPIGSAKKSRVYLLVKDCGRMEQIISQLRKLYDVENAAMCGDSRRFFNVELADF